MNGNGLSVHPYGHEVFAHWLFPVRFSDFWRLGRVKMPPRVTYTRWTFSKKIVFSIIFKFRDCYRSVDSRLGASKYLPVRTKLFVACESKFFVFLHLKLMLESQKRTYEKRAQAQVSWFGVSNIENVWNVMAYQYIIKVMKCSRIVLRFGSPIFDVWEGWNASTGDLIYQVNIFEKNRFFSIIFKFRACYRSLDSRLGGQQVPPRTNETLRCVQIKNFCFFSSTKKWMLEPPRGTYAKRA